VVCKTISDTSNNTVNWNHLRIIQKISGQHKWQPRHQGTTESSHVEHWSHIQESSTNAKYEEFSRGIIEQAQYIFNTELLQLHRP